MGNSYGNQARTNCARRVWLALLVILIAATGSRPAWGQIRFLPASEFERINVRRPQTVVRNLEQMIQTNDFERLAAFREDSRYRRAAHPVGRLKTRVQGTQHRTGTGLCTAMIVSEKYVLTNHHCIPGLLGVRVLEARLEMDYLDEKHTESVKSFPVEPDPVESSERLDYAILRVRGDPASQYGVAPLSSRPAHVGESIFVIHHPEGAPMTLSRKDCTVEEQARQEFRHSCDTLGGSSGSPIFSDDTLEVVGLHFAGSSEGNFGKSIAALRSESRILQSLIAAGEPAQVGNANGYQGASAPARQPLRLTVADPAADQVRRALSFWKAMEESGAKAPLIQDAQSREADAFWKKQREDKFFR